MSKFFRLAEALERNALAEGLLVGPSGASPSPNRPGDALVGAANAVGYYSVGYHIEAGARALPQEVGRKTQLDQARTDWQAATDEVDNERMMRRLADLRMR